MQPVLQTRAMTDKDTSLQLQEYIGKARKVYIVTKEKPEVEILCSAVSLHNELTLRDKQVTIFAPDMSDDHAKILSGVEKKFTYLPEQRTTIKVHVENKGIKKVNYDMKGDTLTFYLTPKEGQIYGEDVQVFTPRLHADLVITLGLQKPSQLSQWPNTWAEEFIKEGAIINVDISSHNTQYGSLDIVEPTSKTIVLLVKDILHKMTWGMSKETASILLQGLTYATDHFRSHVDPDVFSLASYLMEKGAVMSSNADIENTDKVEQPPETIIPTNTDTIFKEDT